MTDANCKRENRLAEIDVLVLGDALVDQQYYLESFPVRGEESRIRDFSAENGGSAANAAIGLAFSGIRTAFCGRLGRDEVGQSILAEMREFNVNTELLQFSERSGFTLTLIDPEGERTMLSYRGAAGEPFERTADLEAALRTAKILLLSGYSFLIREQALGILDFIEIARAAGTAIALDPSPLILEVEEKIRTRLLALTDILLPNRSEALQISGTRDKDSALTQLGRSFPLVLMKDGARGAYFIARKGEAPAREPAFEEDIVLHCPGERRTLVDATGAGDAFNAGFLAAWLRGESPEACLRRANHLAGEIILCIGARGAYHHGLKSNNNF